MYHSNGIAVNGVERTKTNIGERGYRSPHLSGPRAEMYHATYLDTKVLVDLDHLSKGENVLHERGEFPAVAEPLQQAWLF